jgi:hypothetical protein
MIVQAHQGFENRRQPQALRRQGRRIFGDSVGSSVRRLARISTRSSPP